MPSPTLPQELLRLILLLVVQVVVTSFLAPDAVALASTRDSIEKSQRVAWRRDPLIAGSHSSREERSHLVTGAPSTGAPVDIWPDPMSSWFGETASFRICSPTEPQTERAIEQFIAGRAFMTVSLGRPDGCADLTIVVFPQSSVSGRQSTSLSFSSGSGPTIRVRIVSEQGRTRVSIGGAGRGSDRSP